MGYPKTKPKNKKIAKIQKEVNGHIVEIQWSGKYMHDRMGLAGAGHNTYKVFRYLDEYNDWAKRSNNLVTYTLCPVSEWLKSDIPVGEPMTDGFSSESSSLCKALEDAHWKDFFKG